MMETMVYENYDHVENANEQAKAREDWIARDDVRKSIQGLGRNDKCPVHGKKIKKCGCWREAQAKVTYKGKAY